MSRSNFIEITLKRWLLCRSQEPSCLAWTYLCQEACFQCMCPGSHPLPGWWRYSVSRKHVKSSWLDFILAWDPQNSSPDSPPIVKFGGLDACLHWWRHWPWMRVPKRRRPCVSYCGHQCAQEPSCLAWAYLCQEACFQCRWRYSVLRRHAFNVGALLPCV